MDLVGESTVSVLGQLHTLDFLTIYPHSSAPCHNLQKNIDVNADIIPTVTNEFCYEITCPVPINRPSPINRHVVNGMDPALKILKEKNFWEKHKTELLKYCAKSSVDNISEDDLKTGNSFSVPFCVLLLGKHFSEDPDKYFNHNYNVYYYGGNLTTVDFASEKYLVSPKKCEDKELICIQRLSEVSEWKKAPSFESKSTETSSCVLQIESFENLIIAREKQRLCLLSINECSDGSLEIINILNKNSESPFLSVSLHKQLYCTTSAERKVKIFDIDKQRLISRGMIESEGAHTTDNWCAAHFVDENTICFIDRSCVRFIDLRSKTTAPQSWHISDVTEQCEEVYAGANGSRGVQYITTSHQLLSLDRRSGFSQRWTHGITHSPTYLSLPALESGSDKIFIGSQICDSVVFIENNYSKGSHLSSSHPYLLPNISDTFHMARYNGCCLGNTVASRFSMSLTGLCTVEDKIGLNVLRLTSVGDIFSQSMTSSYYTRDIKLSDEDVERLEYWEDECNILYSQEKNHCTSAKIYEDKHIINHLRTSNDYIEPHEELDFTKVPWGASKKELMSYCDYLAPTILEEWGIEDIEEWAPDLNEQPHAELSSSDEEDDITEKVSRWMEKYAEGDDDDDTNYYFSEGSDEDEAIFLDPSEFEPDEPNKVLGMPSGVNKPSVGF